MTSRGISAKADSAFNARLLLHIRAPTATSLGWRRRELRNIANPPEVSARVAIAPVQVDIN